MSQFPTVIVGVTAQGGFVPFNGGEVSEDRTAFLSIFGVTEAAALVRDRVIVNYQFDSDSYAMKPGFRAVSYGAGGDIGWRWLSWITGFSGGFTGAKGEGNTWEYRPNAAIAGVTPGTRLQIGTVYTSGAADPSWTSSELALTVPTLAASNINYRHFVYDAAWREWTGSELGNIDIAAFGNKLKDDVDGAWSSVGAAAYRSYFGSVPAQLVMNTPHPDNPATEKEMHLWLPLSEDITTTGTPGQKVYDAFNSLLSTANAKYPSTQVSWFDYPILPFYIFPKIVDGVAVDAANWSSCAWCGTPAEQVAYLQEKERIRALLRQRVQMHAPNVDSVSVAAYPTQTEVRATQISSQEFLYQWVFEACNGAREGSTKPVIVDTNYAIDANRDGEWDETRLRSLTLSQLISEIDTLGTGIVRRLILSNNYMNSYVFNAIKAAGVSSVNFWNAWKYRWSVAAQAAFEGNPSNYDIMFNRKIINDLFLDRSLPIISFSNNSAWALTSTKNSTLQAAASKEVELANLFRTTASFRWNSEYGWDTFVTQSSIANWYKWGVRKFHLHLPWGKVPLGTYGQTAGSDQNYLNSLKAQGNTWTPEALYYQPDSYVCAREGFIDPFSGLTGNLPMPWLTNDTVDGVVQGFVPLFQTLISGSTSQSKLSADIWERLTGCCGASAWYNPADPIEVSCYLGTVNYETFPRWKRWWEAWTNTAPGTIDTKATNPLSGTAESQNYFLSQTLSGVSYANARLLASYEPVARAGMKLALDALVDCPGPVVQQNKVGKNPLPLFGAFNGNLSINFGLPGTPNSITKSPWEFRSGITYGVTLDQGWWNFFSTQIVPTFGRNRVYAESHPWTVPVNGEWSGALGWTANPYLGFNIMTAEEWGRAGFGGDPNSTVLNNWRSHYRGEYGNVEYLGVMGWGPYPHVGQYTTSGGTVLNGEYGHLATKTDGTPNSRLLRRLAEAGEGSNLQPPLPTNDPDARFIRLNTLPIPDPINGTDFASGYPGEALWGGDWVLNGLLRKPYQTNDPTLANDKTVHFVNMPTNTIFRLPDYYSSQLLTAYGITAEFIRRFPNIQSFAQHLAVLKTNGHSVLAGGKTFAPPSYTRGSGSETPEALASAQVELAKRRERVERIEGTLWLDPEEYDAFAGTNLSGRKNGAFYVPTVETDLPQQRLNLWLDSQIRHWLDRFGTFPRNIAWKMTKAGRWGESLSINSSQATLQGDVNGDGVVDSQDIALVLAAFGSIGGPADVNGDGIVDTQDLAIVLANQGSVASGEGTKTFTPNGFEMERYLFQPRTIPNPNELASNPNSGLGFGGTNRWLYWGGQTAGTRWDTSISSEKLLNTGYDMERIGSPADPLFTAAQSIVTAMVNRTKAWKTTRKIPSRVGVKNIPFLPKAAYPVYRVEPINGKENSNAVLKASGNWNDSVFPVGVTGDSVFLSQRTTTDWHTAADTVKIKAAIKTEFRKRLDPIAAECEVLMPEILDFGTDHLPSDNIDQTIEWQKEQLNVAHDLKTVGSWSTSNNGTPGAPVFSGAIVPCTSSLNWGADYPGMSYGDPRTTKRGVLFDENGSYYRTIDWLVDEFVRQRGRNPTAASRKIAGLCIDRSYLERLWNALRSDSSSSRTADRNWVSRWKRAEEGGTGYINWASTNAVYGSTGTQAFFTYSTDQDTKRLNRFRFLVPPGGRINPYKGGVFAVTWTQGYDPIGHPQAIDGLTITDVVPYVRLGDRLRLDEGAGYTGPLPNPYMNTTVTRARYIPQDKRVLLPYYYHQDPISDFRSGTDYWKNTGDGATYTGSLAYRAHESAGNLRIPTPWAYRQAAAAAESIMASLGVLGATGITFGYISDGTESLRLFSPASFIHNWEVFGPTGMPAVLNDEPDGSPFYYVERFPSYLTEPDTRIVSSFLNGVTVDTAVSEVSGLSFAASVEKYYKEMVANVENMGHYAYQAIGIPPNQTASATYDDIVGYYANEGLNSTIQTNGIPHGISASTGPAWSSAYAPPYVPAALQPASPPTGNPYRSPYYYTMSVSNGRTISNYIAWKASERALWNHVYGDLLKIQWVDPLEQSTNKQYRAARFAKSEYFPTSIPEGALTRTGFGHSFMEYNEIPWLDPSPYLYGRSASYMWDSWYYPNPTTPFQRHQIENRSGMAGAVRFNGARSYIAFLLDISLTRAMLRTNPRLWRHFSPWTTGNYEGSAGSIWSFDVADQSASGAQKTDPQYNKELTFHLLTTGVPYLNYFHARNPGLLPANSGYTAGVTWMQGILNEWNSLTNGQRVQPVSTVDGSPDTLQERILMKDVGGNHEGATGVFMSGCRVLGYSRGKTGERGYPNETYLWRLTAAPQATILYRVDDPSRILSDLPTTISLGSERGAWIRRVGISEPPVYTMSTAEDFSIDPVPDWTDIFVEQSVIGGWGNLQIINGTNRTVTLRLTFSKNSYAGSGTSSFVVNRNGSNIAQISCITQPPPYEFTVAPGDNVRFGFQSTNTANFSVTVFNVTGNQALDTFTCGTIGLEI